jgi:hypothetical protein
MTLSEFLIGLAYDVGKLQAFLYDKEYYLQGVEGLSAANKDLLLSGSSEDINAALAAENASATISDDGGGHIKLTKNAGARRKKAGARRKKAGAPRKKSSAWRKKAGARRKT